MPDATAIQRFFEAHAPDWDAQMPENIGAVLRRFAAPLAGEFQSAHAILEIGTGTGAFIPILNEAAPESRLVSLDMAAAMLANARRRCPTALLVQADVHDLPFAGGSLDLVVCHNSFPHFADKQTALKAMHRVLRPGGRLFILHNNSRAFVNDIHRRAGGPIEHDLLPPGDEMRRLLDEAGYIAVQVEDAPDHYIARAQRPPL
ncbi:MAG: methyltransferase domain-containing protein [Chloroflexi bacterium]|nr:methyltransferase domain-containing protein [Chloroflexota bacterium]